jgi:hypothetical protein
MDSVIGPVKFDSLGENTVGKALTFQWQKGTLLQALPVATAGSHPPLYPKPVWKG